jgi:CRP-like cAMP-binding protein
MSHRRACTLPVSDRAEIIRQSEIGASLDEDTLARLAEASKAFDFRRRRFVYRAGEVADALYVIARGRVKLCSIDEATEREAVIDIVGRARSSASLRSTRRGCARSAPSLTSRRACSGFPRGFTGRGWLRAANFMITPSAWLVNAFLAPSAAS